jgi:uncharacterized protein YjgD (DUF1641 family)
MEQEMLALNQKLDALTAQVAYLTEQAQLAERSRQERAELMQDLMPAVKGAYDLAVTEFQEVEAYARPEDLLVLLKRLLRNRANLEVLLDQAESLTDLLGTVGPISQGAFDKLVALLEVLERKGYFVFARGGMQIADNIVTSFGQEDVKALGDNIVLILQTLRSMTQPEVMNFLRNTVTIIEGEKEQPVNTSLFALLGQMRDPNVRRGLAVTMRVLRTIGVQTAAPL